MAPKLLDSSLEVLKRSAAAFTSPGRGDLTVSNTSSPWIGPEDFRTITELSLIGNRSISYSTLFQTQPWIAAAVMRMLTWSIRVPLKVYRREDDDRRVRLRPEDHPLAAAVGAPWDRGSMAQLIQFMLGPVLVHGNSVIEVQQGARDTIQFNAKDWRFVQPIRQFRDEIQGFKVDTDQKELTRNVSIDSLLHVAWWSPAGPIGTSPLQQLGVTLKIEDAAQRYQTAMFRSGARPPSAITASEEFLGLDRSEREDIMKQLRGDITDIYSGPDNAGRPALLPPGLDWKPVGHSAEEAELIDQRKIAREEIVGVYMIPPPMLGILDKATYSNIETQREMVYTDCLGPPLVLIEQAMNAQIVRNLLGETDIYVEFDFAGVLRGDRLKEIQALREAISSALLTPNEGRGVLNQEKSKDPGMDTFYIPGNNLVPVGTPPGTLAPAPADQGSGSSQAKSVHVVSREEGSYEKVLP